MPLIVDDLGRFDGTSCRDASSAEFTNWVRDRLDGRDLLVPGGTELDSERFLAVASLHEVLDDNGKDRLRQVVRLMLSDAVHNAAAWTATGTLQLLRLVEVFFRDSLARAETAAEVVTLIENTSDSEVHASALRALVGLGGAGLPAPFWRRHYRGAATVPPILEALSRNSLSEAFEFLSNCDASPQLRASLMALVPTWRAQYGQPAVTSAVRRYERRLPVEVTRAVSGALGVEIPSLRVFRNPQRTIEPVARIRHELALA